MIARFVQAETDLRPDSCERTIFVADSHRCEDRRISQRAQSHGTKSNTLSPRISLLELHAVFPSNFVQLVVS